MKAHDREVRAQRMLAYHAAGLSTAEIARQVGVTARTVLRILGPAKHPEAQAQAYGEGTCQTCSRHKTAVTQTEGDLFRAARKAAADPMPWRLRIVDKARAERDRAKAELDAHAVECQDGEA